METIIVSWIGASGRFFTTRMLLHHLQDFTTDVTEAGGRITESHFEV